jgi:hypothetical protein
MLEEQGIIGVMIVQSMLDNKAETLVLDGIKIEDRPAAVGYFLLNRMRDLYAKHTYFPPVRVSFGAVEAVEVNKKKDVMPVTQYNLTGSDFGDIFKLSVAVERGDKDLLDE